uniref:ARF interacting protein 1 n=1 Tax=Leptobrachium leishanense TaxID=445787 RepID=A0A8C5QGC1_9ANUR
MNMSENPTDTTPNDATMPASEEGYSDPQELTMAQDFPRGTAAEISVTSNGEINDNSENGYNMEEFGYNAETQKLIAKNGETLLGAINFFISGVNTLVNKTIEDTLVTVKQYESARIEYDAYRTDLEELNLGPRDANTLPKIEQSQQLFQAHKEKYDKMRGDVSVKLKFLEENKVKVLHNQLVLFHNAIAAYFAGNQKQLEQTLKTFHIKLKTPGVDAPSWLEEQ